MTYDSVHPDPVDDWVGGRIYVYRTDVIWSEGGDVWDRYAAYTQHYPAGEMCSSGPTVAGVIRKARRRAARLLRDSAPVDVSRWTQPPTDGVPSD